MGKVIAVIAGGVATIMDNCFAGEVAPVMSLTVTPNENVPLVLGVPLNWLVPGFSCNPGGVVPLTMVQLPYGGDPPVAAKFAEYEAPTVAPGSELVATVGPP